MPFAFFLRISCNCLCFRLRRQFNCRALTVLKLLVVFGNASQLRRSLLEHESQVVDGRCRVIRTEVPENVFLPVLSTILHAVLRTSDEGGVSVCIFCLLFFD